MKDFRFLLLSLFIISSCGGGGGGGSSTSIPLPNISISTNATNVNLDDTVELSWNVSNATSCSATGDWTGVKSISGNETIPVSKPGSNSFGLSCTGEGGSASNSVNVFAFDIGANNTNLSTDEDVSITNASVAVEPNETVTVSYSLVNSTSNGSLNFNDLNATVSYFPKSNFNGTDQFTIRVSIPEKSIEKDILVTINVASVNDAPTITLDPESQLSKLDIVYDINPVFNFSF